MRNPIGIIVVILIILAGGWLVLNGTPDDTDSTTITATSTATGTNTTGVDTNTAATTTTSAPAGVTVTYTDQGFSPANITVSSGTPVTFVNQSSGDMWVASAMHPSHTVYSGTSLSQHCPDTSNTAFDQCAAGDRYTFTFNKVGTWKYHDHLKASRSGSVTVTAQ